jgi:2-phosphosulfolactate phosphatase
MPAPDLPPPPHHDPGDRPLAVHLTTASVRREDFDGAVSVVIDTVRATTTIAAALAAGARAVVPVLSVSAALSWAADLRAGGEHVVLGGERGGVIPEGFDLGNSPADYTAERVGGKTVVFSTTNGTATLLHAQRARRVVVGALVNRAAVAEAVAHEPGLVRVVCAGTRDEVSLDDCLAAGAIVERLIESGRGLVSDDSGLMCLAAWRAYSGRAEAGLRESRGGRNLVRVGLEADLAWCARVDALGVVPEYDVATGRVVAGPLVPGG